MALIDCIEKALKARKINGAIAALNTQLNDALNASYRAEKGPLTTYWKVIEGILR